MGAERGLVPRAGFRGVGCERALMPEPRSAANERRGRWEGSSKMPHTASTLAAGGVRVAYNGRVHRLRKEARTWDILLEIEQLPMVMATL